MEILLAAPRGFCAGVENAIDALERVLDFYGPPVYVNHDIVHNQTIIDDFCERGVIFLRDEDPPEDSIVLISAHGIGLEYENYLRKRCKHVIDATCPLVLKVHRQAQEYQSSGNILIIIGHQDHQEVKGTLGRIDENVIIVQNVQDAENLDLPKNSRIAYVSQTTLSISEVLDIVKVLRSRFPNIHGPDTRNICYATQNRQYAMNKMLEICDAAFVIGSRHSSNTMSLYNMGTESNVDTYIIENAQCADLNKLMNRKKIGIISGASAPEYLVKEFVEHLKKNFDISNVSEFQFTDEKVRFLPINIDMK